MNRFWRRVAVSVLGIVAALALWTAIVWAFFPPDREGEGVYRALLAIHRCARNYVWGDDRPVEAGMYWVRTEYPRDLRQLGPNGTKCLGAELSLGIVDGWDIALTPLVDSSRAVGYELRTSPVGVFRKPKLRHYSIVHPFEGTLSDPIDRNAIVHVRRDGTPASESDPVYGSPLPNMRVLLRCMKLDDHAGDTWVVKLGDAASCLPTTAFRVEPDTDAKGRSRARTWGPGFDYTVVYTPGRVQYQCDEPVTKCQSGIIDLDLDVRPTQYGVTGIRSYGIYQGGLVTADWTNPAVVYVDRLIPECETEIGAKCGAVRKWLRLTP